MNIKDDRWGGYIPWSLRDESLPGTGNFKMFFNRVGQRLETCFRFAEAGAINDDMFGSFLESESLQRYRHNANHYLAPQLTQYFDSDTPLEAAEYIANMCNPDNLSFEQILCKLHLDRLGVLEIILCILNTQSPPIARLRRDIRRFLVEAGIPLDLSGVPPAFVPLDEPLLQREVIDRLLPRLEARFPQRAKELIAAYHGLISREKPGDVFLAAFGTLE